MIDNHTPLSDTTPEMIEIKDGPSGWFFNLLVSILIAEILFVTIGLIVVAAR